MVLTKNFQLSEFQYSHTAIRMGIDNTVPVYNLPAVRQTAQRLQEFRDWLCAKFEKDLAIHITSGYRSPRLNDKIKGSSKSHHCTGHAADIKVSGFTGKELTMQVLEWLETTNTPFDQLIDEYGHWVHISFFPTDRRIGLIAVRTPKGFTSYRRFTQS